MTASRRIRAAVVTALLASMVVGCTPSGTPAPTPASRTSTATPSATTGTATPPVGPPTGMSATTADPASTVDAAVNCAGPLAVPDLTGLPVVAPTEPAQIRKPSGAVYTVTVGLDEESQHPDLPADSPEEVLMFPVTIAVITGTLDHADAFSFQVYDSVSTRICALGEDPIGYTPILASELGAGQEVHGFMGFKVPKVASRFTIVYFVDGVAAAAWR